MGALTSCCCCFSLKTGSLIIAILGWISTMVKLFGGPVVVGNYYINMSSSTGPYSITYSVLAFIFSVCLIIGIIKESTAWFPPYLIISGVECVLWSIVTIVSFGYIFSVPAEYTSSFITTTLVLLCLTVLSWYFWKVVYSYYHHLKDQAIAPHTVTHMYPPAMYPNPPPPYEGTEGTTYPNHIFINVPHYNSSEGNAYPNQAYTNK